MFKLQLDISLYFVPPMVEQGKGICITHEFDLPFQPSEKIFLAGIVLNGASIPLGYKLNDITWDMDRQVFFAKSSEVLHDFPLASIPLELWNWLDRGWHLGSYEDTYEKADGRAGRIQREPIVCRWDWRDEELTQAWEAMKPRSRLESFNDLFKALIREMAILENNSAVAYAMDRTKMFFPEDQLDKNEGLSAKRFKDAQSKFNEMTYDEMCNWRENVVRRYPHLSQFVAKRPRRARKSAEDCPVDR